MPPVCPRPAEVLTEMPRRHRQPARDDARGLLAGLRTGQAQATGREPDKRQQTMR